jgi:mono/diheme cytochrome c family protein
VKRLAAIALLSALGCRGQTSEEPPVALLRNMHQQQRYNPQARSRMFADGRTMRPPVEGTVPFGSLIDDARVATGREEDNSAYVPTVPEPVAAQAQYRDDEGRRHEGMDALVLRGHERFNIYCAPCHGRAGDGLGMVFLRSRRPSVGFPYPQPTSLHEARVRHMPDGQLFATVSNGVRNMPSYAAQIPVNDRWAIVAYVRALELSQAPNDGAMP